MRLKSNSFIIKNILYLFSFSFFIFYSGNNIFSTLLNEDYHAFSDKKSFAFQPEELPLFQNKILPEPLTASSYIIMDLDSFTPLIAQNEKVRHAPASTVKLATALVSFAHYPLDKVLRVKTVIDEENKMGLVTGEEMSTLNVLYGALLYSANDAAYTLAENFPGGVKEFVKQMNLLALKYHMDDTHFMNPIGFDDKKQKSTAYDLAILGREFIRHKLLTSITSTKSITVSDIHFRYFHYLVNVNEFVGTIPNVGGLKTGTTDEAGQNLITYYQFQGKPLLIIVLKSEERFEDTKKLFELINTNLTYQEIR